MTSRGVDGETKKRRAPAAFVVSSRRKQKPGEYLGLRGFRWIDGTAHTTDPRHSSTMMERWSSEPSPSLRNRPAQFMFGISPHVEHVERGVDVVST